MKIRLITLRSVALTVLLWVVFAQMSYADVPAYCPDCGTLLQTETAWDEFVALEHKESWKNALAPKQMCFEPGTPEDVVASLVNRIYQNPASYISGSRWTSTASGTSGTQGTPTVLTYSFVPDGVTVPDDPPPNGFGNQTNNIHAMMTSKFGSVANGKARFRAAFDQWQALTGLTYVEETNDDGAALFSSVGVLGVRGDIRISAVPMDGSFGVLAYNYFPNTGDMVLDNAENWGNSSNSYRYFRNVVTHEAGHGIGLFHVCPDVCEYLMEPFICTAYDGPQHDDIRGGQRLYGDTTETNDSPATATFLGSPADGTTTRTNLSIDDNTDQDYLSFTVPVNKQVTVTMTPVGEHYAQCAQTQSCTCSSSDSVHSHDDVNLSVRLYDTNGTTILGDASGQPAGVAETIANTALPGAGTYYIRVYQQTVSDQIQMYNLSFTLSPAIVASITVTQPNGGETWTAGNSQNITWTSANVTGNVNIELNRDYPAGSWELLFGNTANDGTQAWTVSGIGGTEPNCRVRVTSISFPTATDESDNNFTIFSPSITIVRPNGGELLNAAALEQISLVPVGFTGDVNVELNRGYPAGQWEFLGTIPQTGGTKVFGGPPTTTARVRLTSVNSPGVSDVSDANFEIFLINEAPVLTHDPHGDIEPGSAVFTALVTDDGGPISAQLHYRVSGGGAFAVIAMPASGNQDEYQGDYDALEGSYDYFITATDGSNQVQTDTFSFDVEPCPAAIVFDDGTAEGYNWANETPFEWAVKYDPPAYPFLLCGFQVAVAKFHPDNAHSPIGANVYLADGIGSLPGTQVWSEESGSIGNVVGGLPANDVVWATVMTLDALGDPLIMTEPFFVSVKSPTQNSYEAFGRDDSSPSTNSYFFDGCDLTWYSENDFVPNAQGGQRMIRILGAALPAPTELVILPSGNDIVLFWNGSGAPYYRIYSATTTSGPFLTLEGSTATTTFTDVGAVLSNDVKFYVVVASTAP
ncbi:MAG: matrixin family metalloprotease [Calditrichaeota bacterium]|nr:matrixin family metalloprotease [Calditrichota bacterium]MCB9366935.1 matrixin family metalloprotease [Calditrichota bacterium]